MTSLRWVFVRGVLWTIELRDPPPSVAPRIAAELRQVGAESTPALVRAFASADDSPGGAADIALRERFESGRRCFAAWVGGEIAAYGWVSRRPEYIGEQEREINVPPNEAYIWDCATLPPYRGQRLYSALLGFMASMLREEGVRRAWIGTALDNLPSLRGFAIAGFRPVIAVTHARLGSLSALWIGAQPHAPPETVKAARRMWLRADERHWGPLAVRWARPPIAARAALPARGKRGPLT